jgi:hypothetical protein
MKMQDREFDELFRSKLDALEIEPSAGLWPAIAGKINSAKNTKLMTPYLSAAASVIILVAAGIFFIPGKVKVPPISTVSKRVGSARGPLNSQSATATNNDREEIDVTDKSREPGIAVNQVAKRPYRDVSKRSPVKKNPSIHDRPESIEPDESLSAAFIAPKQEAVQPTVPDAGTQLTIKQPVTEATGFMTKPGIAPVQLPVYDKENAEPVRAKHKIHSVGGLINMVVAKVDKRKDKIIEFSENDDDGSNITGVNLGIIKIKKEK